MLATNLWAVGKKKKKTYEDFINMDVTLLVVSDMI